MKATIKNSDKRTIATARKKETEVGFPDYIEKAETGAIIILFPPPSRSAQKTPLNLAPIPHSSSVFEKQRARWQRKKSREPAKQREIRAVKGWEIKTKEANGQQKSGDEVDLPASPRK